MLEIKIDNINSQVVGNRTDVINCCDILTHKYTQWVKWKNQKRPKKKNLTYNFLNPITGTFPTGLLFYLLKKLKEIKIEYVLIDERVKPTINFKPISKSLELRDYQKEAIEATIKYQRVIWEIATNGGKTRCASALIQNLNTNTLFLVHNKILFEQAYEVLSSLLNEKIGVIKANKIDLKKVTVAMIPTLYKRLDHPEIEDFLNGLNLIILDEGHKGSAATYEKILFSCPAYYRVLMSGTIPEEDTLNGKKVRSLAGDVLITISNKELIDKGISATPNINFIRVLGEIEYTGTSFLELAKVGIVNYESRNNLIIREAEKYAKEGKTTVILVWLKEHGNLLKSRLDDARISSKFIFGDCKDNLEVIKEFKAGNLKTLISTPLLDEGFDTDKIEVLILAAGGKSSRQLLQRLGRGLRKKEGGNKVEIIDFMDYQHLKLLKHSMIRKKILEKQGFTVTEID